MSLNSEHIHYILQYYFDQGDDAVKRFDIHGEDSLSNSAVRKEFTSFRSGNFDAKDVPRSGRPIVEKVDVILQKVKTSRYIYLNMRLNHLHKARYKKRSYY